MESGNRNLSSSESGVISEGEMPGARNEIPMGEAFDNMAGVWGEGSLKRRHLETRACRRIPPSWIPGLASWVEGRSAYTMGNKLISAGRENHWCVCWRKSKIRC